MSRSARLEEEYRNVTTQFRTLTEIRFKLLGLLPLGTAVALLLAKDDGGSPPFAVALFGLIVTVAIAAYDTRNDQLYNELVSRAGELERQLGLPNGSFAQRPGTWMKEWPFKIEHGWPVALIYGASAGVWLVALMSSLLRRVLDLCNVADFRICSARATLVRSGSEIAIPIGAGLIIAVVYWLYKSARKDRTDGLKREIVSVVPKLALVARANAHVEEAAIKAVAADIGPIWPVEQKAVVPRFLYYLNLPQFNEFTPPLPSDGPIGDECAYHVLAGVVDMPARWIRDVHRGRRD